MIASKRLFKEMTGNLLRNLSCRSYKMKFYKFK